MATLLELIDSGEKEFKDALGAKRDFRSWFAVTRDYVRTTGEAGTVKYQLVKGRQILNAFLTAAKLGLMVDGKESMVMVRGQKDPQIRCEIGFAGVIRLAGQAGALINARTIHAGDKIEIDEGAGTVHHTPAWILGREEGDVLGYYAAARYKSGLGIVRAISLQQVREKHSTNTSVWKNHPNAMGEKTAILHLGKVLYYGDEIEAILSGSAAAVEDHVHYEDAEDTPQHPPKTVSDKVAAAAARAEQDANAESDAYDLGEGDVL